MMSIAQKHNDISGQYPFPLFPKGERKYSTLPSMKKGEIVSIMVIWQTNRDIDQTEM